MKRQQSGYKQYNEKKRQFRFTLASQDFHVFDPTMADKHISARSLTQMEWPNGAFVNAIVLNY